MGVGTGVVYRPRAIAFTWSAKSDGTRQIYVKWDIDAEPKKLTSSTVGQIGYLAWSPDGKRIAFKRQFDREGVLYWIASGGGEEQKILDLASANLSSSIDWSPDGKLLAFSESPPGKPEHLVIYVHDMQTGEKRKSHRRSRTSGGIGTRNFRPTGKPSRSRESRDSG
jgi:Tol biopolymer transport system component